MYRLVVKQRGFVLIGVLMLLLVMNVLTLSAMQIAHEQLRMADFLQQRWLQ